MLAILDSWPRLSKIEKAVQLAAMFEELGIEESPRGSNDGKMVRAFWRVAGYTSPSPWCLCFLYYCFKRSGFSDWSNPRGHCKTFLNWAEGKNLVVSVPQRGDIGILVNKDGSGHAVLVVGPSERDGYVRTIEGNGNDAGDREGYEVCRRERRIDSLRFVRLVK